MKHSQTAPAAESHPSVCSLRGLCKRWGVSYSTLVRLIETGKLRAFKVGEQWRVPLSAIEAIERGEAA